MSKPDGGPAFPTGEWVRSGDRERGDIGGGKTPRETVFGEPAFEVVTKEQAEEAVA